MAGFCRSQLYYSATDNGTTANMQTPYDGAFISLTTQLAGLTPDITLRSGAILNYGVYKNSDEIDKEAYITVPLDVRGYGQLGNVTIYGGLGPRISYGLMSSVEAANGNGVSVDVYKSTDYKRFDVKLGFSFGLIIKEKYIVEMAVDRGFLTRFEDTSSNMKMSSNFLRLGVGMAF